MKNPQIQRIIPHFVQADPTRLLSGRIAGLHVQVIENRLNRLNLTAGQKLRVIDRILDNRKAGGAPEVSKAVSGPPLSP